MKQPQAPRNHATQGTKARSLALRFLLTRAHPGVLDAHRRSKDTQVSSINNTAPRAGSNV